MEHKVEKYVILENKTTKILKIGENIYKKNKISNQYRYYTMWLVRVPETERKYRKENYKGVYLITKIKKNLFLGWNSSPLSGKHG